MDLPVSLVQNLWNFEQNVQEHSRMLKMEKDNENGHGDEVLTETLANGNNKMTENISGLTVLAKA